jgi:hypothetical protein
MKLHTNTLTVHNRSPSHCSLSADTAEERNYAQHQERDVKAAVNSVRSTLRHGCQHHAA